MNSILKTLRISPGKRSNRGDEVDAVQPVYVGEFPQVVRDAQIMSLQNHIPGWSGKFFLRIHGMVIYFFCLMIVNIVPSGS